MALHDYACPACGARAVDQYRPITIRASQLRPLCPSCAVLMTWCPQVQAMDAPGGGSFTPFPVFVRQPDGSERSVTVSSLAHLRRIERQTEAAARNGEGQPLRFRAWNNDASNQDRNTFGPDPGEVAKARLDAMRREAGRATSADAAATIPTGPGVAAAGVSPLPA